MLDYRQYFSYCMKKEVYVSSEKRRRWFAALMIKCILNIRGYSSYRENPVLGFKFMKDGFSNCQREFVQGDKQFIINDLDSIFIEKQNDEVLSIGKFYVDNRNLFSEKHTMVYMINIGVGFCIIKVSCDEKNEYKEGSVDRWNFNMKFYDNKVFNYIHEIPDEELRDRDKIRRDEHENIILDSLLDLFYDCDNLDKYISPDFENTYIGFKPIPDWAMFSGVNPYSDNPYINSKKPVVATEPEFTYLFKQCFKDISKILKNKKIFRRIKSDFRL